jgi:hypothetical protein
VSNKITYLIGAGASANAIPVVEKFNDSVLNFIEIIKNYKIEYSRYGSFNASIHFTKGQLRDIFVEDSKSIIDKISSGHTTVDNYARMLYLTKEYPELRKLKSLLQFYLLWKQFEIPYDKRYDLFLASIFNLGKYTNELTLPGSIQIISWNYDIQFEIAANNYYKVDLISYIQDSLNSSSIINSLKKANQNELFSITRLNGNCIGWYKEEIPQTYNIQLNIYKNNKTLLIEDMLAYYHWLGIMQNEQKAGIDYAWENNDHARKIREIASSKAEKTEVLVIIGYSFPTFNRSIDRALISKMKNLKKVYIQTMKPSISEVTNRFESLANINNNKRNTDGMIEDVEVKTIEMFTGTEEFYIPFEYIGE